MHEDLFGDAELTERSEPPLISHTRVPTFSPLTSREIDPWASEETVVATLAELCKSVGHELSSTYEGAL